MLIAIDMDPFSGRLLSLSRKKLRFLSKFYDVFNVMQLSKYAVDLIDHITYDVRFDPLFT